MGVLIFALLKLLIQEKKKNDLCATFVSLVNQFAYNRYNFASGLLSQNCDNNVYKISRNTVINTKR